MRLQAASTVAAVLGGALAVSACGSSGGLAAGTGTVGHNGANQGLQFAQCMRTHGVPSFPDPSSGGGVQFGPGSGVDPGAPAFRAAQHACVKLLPGFRGGGAVPASVRRQLLAMAQCMRSHGVPNFPDPTFSAPGGGPGVALNIGGALDPQSPAFQRAARTCGGPHSILAFGARLRSRG